MNSKERVIATLNRQPVDRTPIDCWLYHKYFLDKLAPVYGSREQFMDEYNILEFRKQKSSLSFLSAIHCTLKIEFRPKIR